VTSNVLIYPVGNPGDRVKAYEEFLVIVNMSSPILTRSNSIYLHDIAVTHDQLYTYNPLNYLI